MVGSGSARRGGAAGTGCGVVAAAKLSAAASEPLAAVPLCFDSMQLARHLHAAALAALPAGSRACQRPQCNTEGILALLSTKLRDVCSSAQHAAR